MDGRDSSKGKVYFVGAGPGDRELLTIKAKRLIESADVIVYSGSLLNPEILEYAKSGAVLHDASGMSREEIYSVLKESAMSGRLAIRLHDGDPSLYSATREQIDALARDGIDVEIVPGISALFAAIARLKTELTLPGVTQTVIITRAEHRTPVPERESIRELAKHRCTMAFYLSVHLINDIVGELVAAGYDGDTPVAVVYRATWSDEKVIVGTLKDIASMVREARINRTAVIIVGDVVRPKEYEFSRVYDSEFTHSYRDARRVEQGHAG
ncbi:MAG: precorrin-4 C(11)-methyltransferase [Candidatus Nitrosocaldus sp.]|nr:precorrin-4 C(11)-methyltransferase [Candidatus Nitrosocaldus sp.]MDW7999763.1 precorrin-4 C(11)-methyltransferase [Candidatus Nitrosocaldus sp.]MDW8274877.1 precorrin-4 C(11)-methyltransferase [Candidatus Nitrosocaldus sp.]